MQTLENEIVKYVIENCGAFPERVIEHFGIFREQEISVAIENAVKNGSIVQSWFDGRALGGIRYSVLRDPNQNTNPMVTLRYGGDLPEPTTDTRLDGGTLPTGQLSPGMLHHDVS